MDSIYLNDLRLTSDLDFSRFGVFPFLGLEDSAVITHKLCKFARCDVSSSLKGPPLAASARGPETFVSKVRRSNAKIRTLSRSVKSCGTLNGGIYGTTS